MLGTIWKRGGAFTLPLQMKEGKVLRKYAISFVLLLIFVLISNSACRPNQADQTEVDPGLTSATTLQNTTLRPSDITSGTSSQTTAQAELSSSSTSRTTSLPLTSLTDASEAISETGTGETTRKQAALATTRRTLVTTRTTTTRATTSVTKPTGPTGQTTTPTTSQGTTQTTTSTTSQTTSPVATTTVPSSPPTTQTTTMLPTTSSMAATTLGGDELFPGLEGNSGMVFLFREYGGETGALEAANAWAASQMYTPGNPWYEYRGWTLWTIENLDLQPAAWTVNFYR